MKEFETAEDALLSVKIIDHYRIKKIYLTNFQDVELRTNEMMDMKDTMTQIQNNIEKLYSEIDVSNEKIKEIQSIFQNAAKDNKFWDFLRRIFRKKYKPPKVHDLDGTVLSF